MLLGYFLRIFWLRRLSGNPRRKNYFFSVGQTFKIFSWFGVQNLSSWFYVKFFLNKKLPLVQWFQRSEKQLASFSRVIAELHKTTAKKFTKVYNLSEIWKAEKSRVIFLISFVWYKRQIRKKSSENICCLIDLSYISYFSFLLLLLK